MNQGVIYGVVINNITGAGVGQAVVAINHIENGSERSGRLNLFNEDGSRALNLFTETDENGGFALFFRWDPIEIGHVMSRRAICHLNIGSPVFNGSTVVSYSFSRHRSELARVISLGAINNGTIPNPRESSDLVGMAVDLWTSVRNIRLPMIGRTFMSPSADAPALFGIFRYAVSG